MLVRHMLPVFRVSDHARNQLVVRIHMPPESGAGSRLLQFFPTSDIMFQPGNVEDKGWHTRDNSFESICVAGGKWHELRHLSVAAVIGGRHVAMRWSRLWVARRSQSYAFRIRSCPDMFSLSCSNSAAYQPNKSESAGYNLCKFSPGRWRFRRRAAPASYPDSLRIHLRGRPSPDPLCAPDHASPHLVMSQFDKPVLDPGRGDAVRRRYKLKISVIRRYNSA